MKPVSDQHPQPLFDVAQTRRLEAQALSARPAHQLMQRAGTAVAALARALAPHAQRIWLACGPGNNGGDGLVAAVALWQHAQTSGRGLELWISHSLGEGPQPKALPVDAAWALQQALAAGLQIHADGPPWVADLAIDALLGLGCARPPEGLLLQHLQRLNSEPHRLLCVDLPSGLDANNGHWHSASDLLRPPQSNDQAGPVRHTLALLTLKPGLFTGHGRDACGELWFEDLGLGPPTETPCAVLSGAGQWPRVRRAQASHKGQFGDVWVVGGQGIERQGIAMGGAALLAADAALCAGAGRVLLSLLQNPQGQAGMDPSRPELMWRSSAAFLAQRGLEDTTVVLGCGGGDGPLLGDCLAHAIEHAGGLVLDADGLNLLAQDPALALRLSQRRVRLGRSTVLTPHPLEAARLLGQASAQAVMADRLAAAQQLAERWSCCVVLKGSGSVVAAPGQRPMINPTGNPALASAGSGDVLAGLIGGHLSGLRQSGVLTPETLAHWVAASVYQHGHLADQWVARGGHMRLRAGDLARAAHPL